jgi:predicted nucleotidyltransferase
VIVQRQRLAGTELDAYLAAVTAALVRAFAPERIILSGSFARGDQNRASDLDLVVIASTPLSFCDRARAVGAGVDERDSRGGHLGLRVHRRFDHGDAQGRAERFEVDVAGGVDGEAHSSGQRCGAHFARVMPWSLPCASVTGGGSAEADEGRAVGIR